LKVLDEAWNGDNISAFGGIVAVSFEVSLVVAEFFSDRFIEILMAPSFSEEAKNYLAKKKNLRLLCLPLRPRDAKEKVLRSFTGGVLLQDEDEKFTPLQNYIQKTKKAFTAEQIQLASFGVVACKHLKSNGIALVGKKENIFSLIGTGMGQPNRLDSLRRLAAPRAKEKGFVMSELILISDAFFPFADTVEAAAAEGIRLIVQPGGSLRDSEVIAAADKENMAMIFTGERHFRH
jgi:phosphoribosylaminoimidazolecarboxamide formyltransferase/IMP cyclohydrolase